MEDSDRLSALREQLARRLGSQRYELWIGEHTSFEYAAGELRIGAPSDFELQWLRRRLNQTLQQCVEQLWGSDVAIRYHLLRTPSRPTPADVAPPIEPAVESSLPESHVPEDHPVVTRPAASAQLTPPRRVPSRRSAVKSTFANFVVGKGNELACQTAKSVAEQLGQYGPLLLFGPPGVGKTHLAYAMLQHVRSTHARARAVRLTAEQFTCEFLAALDQRALPGFRQKYRSIDVLFVDDIQFLAGKRATLDELLHSIDTLHERGRQVVFTCDRSPGDLQKLSLELVSRIAGGLAIPIDLPDYPTRLGIVRQQASRLGWAIDEETTALIATHVAGSARRLNGAVNHLVATSQAQGKRVTAELARQTLADYVQQSAPAVGLADIQRAVCQVFGVEAASLKSKRRTRSVTEPRMLAMWLARKYTRSALGEIGEYFGRSSHSTVISAQKRIEGLVDQGATISVADRPCPVEDAIRQVESVLRTA